MSTIIRTTAWIELQGTRVLDMLEREVGTIAYQVIGLDQPNLIIIDHREKVNQFFDQCLVADDFNGFAYSFSSPAQIILQQKETGDLTLSLFDSIDQIPEHMVWIIVGFEGEYPEYDYVFQEVQRDNEGTYSGITIYPLDTITMLDFINAEASGSSMIP